MKVDILEIKSILNNACYECKKNKTYSTCTPIVCSCLSFAMEKYINEKLEKQKSKHIKEQTDE